MTECKNCAHELNEEDAYCPACGAKVIKKRLTFRDLIMEVINNAFGYDSRYFRTLRLLITHPEKPLRDYVQGVRKRHINPFTFFAVGAGLALIVFNQFHDEYIEMTTSQSQIKISESVPEDKDKPAEAKEDDEMSAKINYAIQENMLKYFNLVSFLLLPFYGFIAMKVFGKPYNFGEHVAINAYIQGFSFLMTICLFLISLLTNPLVYLFGIVGTMIYYSYAYGRLYQYSIWQVILKFLRFLLVMSLLFLIFVL
ncbi:MAG: DUF3667 domain-containing protein, partial [Bacteroidota bacterium]